MPGGQPGLCTRDEIYVTTVAQSERFTWQIGVHTNSVAYLPSATAAMIDATPLPFDLPSVRRKKLAVHFEGGRASAHYAAMLSGTGSPRRPPG
jgi:hypothetical protein